MSLLEKYPARLQQLRLAVRTIREGRREKTLALLAVLCFSASLALSTGKAPLPEEIETFLARSHTAAGLFAVAAGLTLWLVVLLWREALPRESRVEIRPSSIKGPMSFGPQDGELFLRLGRDGELAELLGHVLDDQVGMIGVMGESGAGKTSLLRSGLYQLLRQQTPPVSFTYWEALPTDPLVGLLHAIRESLPDKAKATSPKTIDGLVRWADGESRVVVLDQLEQLDPQEPAHAPIFDLLSRLGRRPPPHRVTWIVAYRREFDPVWRDFELGNPHLRARLLSLKLFSREKAKGSWRPWRRASISPWRTRFSRTWCAWRAARAESRR